MSSLAERPLAGEDLARRVLELRPWIVRQHASRNPRLSQDDVDDIFGRLVLVLLEKDPPLVFPNDRALSAWLSEAMRRSLLSHNRADTTRMLPIDGLDGDLIFEPVALEPTPEQHVLLEHEYDTLKEYIAGLGEADRLVALLYLWPSSRLTAKKITAFTGLPLADVRACIHRVKVDFGRYTAMAAGNVCRRQTKHLEHWRREGGDMPAALSFHMRRCSSCRDRIGAARHEAFQSLLPWVPGVAFPAAAAAGVRLRAARALMRALRERASSAVVAGKGAAVAAVVTVGVGAGTVLTVDADHAHRRPAAETRAAVVVAATAPGSAVGADGPSSGAPVPEAVTTDPTTSTPTTPAATSTTPTTTTQAHPSRTATSSIGDAAPSDAQGSPQDLSPAGASSFTEPSATQSTSGSSGVSSDPAGLSPTGKTAPVP